MGRGPPGCPPAAAAVRPQMSLASALRARHQRPASGDAPLLRATTRRLGRPSLALALAARALPGLIACFVAESRRSGWAAPRRSGSSRAADRVAVCAARHGWPCPVRHAVRTARVHAATRESLCWAGRSRLVAQSTHRKTYFVAPLKRLACLEELCQGLSHIFGSGGQQQSRLHMHACGLISMHIRTQCQHTHKCHFSAPS